MLFYFQSSAVLQWELLVYMCPCNQPWLNTMVINVTQTLRSSLDANKETPYFLLHYRFLIRSTYLRIKDISPPALGLVHSLLLNFW